MFFILRSTYFSSEVFIVFVLEEGEKLSVLAEEDLRFLSTGRGLQEGTTKLSAGVEGEGEEEEEEERGEGVTTLEGLSRVRISSVNLKPAVKESGLTASGEGRLDRGSMEASMREARSVKLSNKGLSICIRGSVVHSWLPWRGGLTSRDAVD